MRSWSFSFALQYFADGLNLLMQDNALASFCLKGTDAVIDLRQASGSVNERKEGRGIDLNNLQAVKTATTWTYSWVSVMWPKEDGLFSKSFCDLALVPENKRELVVHDQSSVYSSDTPCNLR